MFCNTCAISLHCCAFMTSECQLCGKQIINANAPPVNELCEECSEKHGLCEQCGRVCDKKWL